jgi:hypothetical protein
VTAADRVSPPNGNVAEKSDKAPLHLAKVTNAATPFASITVAQNNTIAVAPALPARTPMAMPVVRCNNPDVLGLSRVIEIDTIGGPAFGTEHFKQYDSLHDKEVF